MIISTFTPLGGMGLTKKVKCGVNLPLLLLVKVKVVAQGIVGRGSGHSQQNHRICCREKVINFQPCFTLKNASNKTTLARYVH